MIDMSPSIRSLNKTYAAIDESIRNISSGNADIVQESVNLNQNLAQLEASVRAISIANQTNASLVRLLV